MKKLVLLSIFSYLIASCATDTLVLIEDPVDDENEASEIETVDDTQIDPILLPNNENQENYFIDSFDADGPLLDFVTNNASALPNVSSFSGRYTAILEDNTNNVTLHFHEDQGRIDAKLISFPFEFIARNIGIGTLEDSQIAPTAANNPFIFSGIQVHDIDFNSINSSHVVLGHRGGTGFTIEGKNTVNGQSSVNDIGQNTIPNGRGDIRIVGNEDNTLTVYWQTPNLEYATTDDTWALYRDSGNLPGTSPVYDSEVYIGLITYAYGTKGVPFVGTCDAIQIMD